MHTGLVTRAGPSWRAVILVLLGVAISGPIARSELAVGSVAPAVASGKWVSCPSVAFYPVDHDDVYRTDYTGRTGASIRFYCGLTLPHGATIRAAKFHLYDDSVGEVFDCAIVRIRLDPPSRTFQELARVPSTGGPFRGGYLTLTDTSIEHAVVDDRYWAYLAQCGLTHDSVDLQIVGVTLRYAPA
jgi:hypothetical protein